MQFEVFPKRRAGRLLPRHVFWAGKVVGDLYVDEVFDAELRRHVRRARILAGTSELLTALMDATLVGAKPDWYVMTGWERGPDELGQPSALAHQQSWILIPLDKSGTIHRSTSDLAPAGACR